MLIKTEDYFRIVRATTPAAASNLAQAVPEIVDANQDGIADILMFGAYYPFLGSKPVAQAAVLMLGKGDGTYMPAPQLLPSTFTTVHPREIVQADFNGDGLPDLYVAGHGYDTDPFPGEQNHLLLGKQGGGYTDATAGLPQLSDFTHSASAGDIDGDGRLDLFVGNMSSHASPSEAYVLLGDGQGGFSKTNAGLPLETGGLLNRASGNFGMTASLLADLNGDGRLDLVLGNDGNTYNKEHRSLVFWNTGSGFDANAKTFLPQGYFGDTTIVHDIATMDIDGDGDQDLLMLSSESTPSDAYADGWALDALRNDGGVFTLDTLSHFAAADSHEGLPGENSKVGASEFIRLMDVNGDGSKDIVINQFMNNLPGADTPIVWTNDGYGHFEVALRAGQANALAGDQYFMNVLTLPVMGPNGLGFTSINVNGDTIYQTTAQATQMLPPPVRIVATAGSDRIVQNKADNSIDGGAGLDQVVYAKNAAAYAIGVDQGRVTVRDLSGADGTDTLVNVERLAFADQGIAFDVEGSGGQAYRVYQASLGRTPDLGGLGFWMSVMDRGIALRTVAEGFVTSAEFKTVYGADPSNRAIVEQFYQNVLHRPGEESGIAFWTGVLDNKAASLADVLVGFSESAENRAELVGVLSKGFAFLPYA